MDHGRAPCCLYFRAGQYREHHAVEVASRDTNLESHSRYQHNHLEHHDFSCATAELDLYHPCDWVPDHIELLQERRSVRDQWQLHLPNVLLWTLVQLEDERDKPTHSLHHWSDVRYGVPNLLHVHCYASFRPLSGNFFALIFLDARRDYEAALD